MLVLGAASWLIVNGHEGAGVAAIIAEFVTYGGAFLYGAETRRRERKQKSENR